MRLLVIIDYSMLAGLFIHLSASIDFQVPENTAFHLSLPIF